MIYRKEVNIGGQSFEIETEDFTELWRAVSHFREFNFRLAYGISNNALKHVEWRHRNDKDGNDYYEIVGLLEGKRVRFRVGQFKDKKSLVPLFLSGSGRWEHYNKEEDRAEIFEGGEWHIAEYNDGEWTIIETLTEEDD